MAINPKSADNIQVYRGALPAMDVFAQNSGAGCCAPNVTSDYDKLGTVVHFDNALAHLNPKGANDKLRISPSVNGMQREVIDHINAVGAGAQISVLVIPTFALVKSIGVHVAAAETGLTFNLVSRNGLNLALDVDAPITGLSSIFQVASAAGASTCDPLVRTRTNRPDLDGIGALGANEFIDIFANYDMAAAGFALDAEELILEVATVPATPIAGTFDITVAVNYDILLRAAR